MTSSSRSSSIQSDFFLFIILNKKIMASLVISIFHRLSKDEALTRIKKMLTEVKGQHADSVSDLKESWNGNIGTFSFRAKGFAVSGTLTVKENEITLDGTIPFAATFFKRMIKETIETEAKKLLS